MSSFNPSRAIVRLCLSSTNDVFGSEIADKASRLRSALVGRSIFDGAEMQTHALWPAAAGTRIAIGEASEVLSALQEGREEPPALITMFEEFGTRCIVEIGDTRRVGLIIENSEAADPLVTRQISKRLTELRTRLANGGEEWSSNYYNSVSDRDHEETTEMVLRGFPPGREVGWQTTLRTELTILRFMLEVAELSWLEQAADAAQAGVLAFRAQADNRVAGRDASADRAAIMALDFQMYLKERLLREREAWMAPFQSAAAAATSPQERAEIERAAAGLQHLLDREAQCLECRGVLAIGGPGATQPGSFEVPPLVSLYTGTEGHVRYLQARKLMLACEQA
jgi:hypothetical protein